MKFVVWKARARILTEPHSLKEKRGVVKSVLARVRNRFPFSVAEVGDHDIYNLVEFGFCSVGTDSVDLERGVEKCRNALERDFPIEFFEESVSVENF